MKRTIFAAITALVLGLGSFAFADEVTDAGTPAQVYGKWNMKAVQNGFTFDMTLNIQPQQTSGTNVCSYQGQTATVTASVPSEVTATQIVVKGSAHQEAKVGNVTCNIDFNPMTMGYQVTAQTLTLTAQGQNIVLNRVH